MKPLTLLQGERLRLRPLSEADADGDYPAWLNDQATNSGNTHGVFPYSREEARRYIAASHGRQDALILAIELLDSRHIGNIALQAIHPIHRRAEFAILLGDAACRGQGYGLEAGRLLCRHGFQRLNLQRIECGTFAGNLAMQRLALALGMSEEGRRREAAFVAGNYQDIVEFGMTRNDFLNQTVQAEKARHD